MLLHRQSHVELLVLRLGVAVGLRMLPHIPLHLLGSVDAHGMHDVQLPELLSR